MRIQCKPIRESSEYSEKKKTKIYITKKQRPVNFFYLILGRTFKIIELFQVHGLGMQGSTSSFCFFVHRPLHGFIASEGKPVRIKEVVGCIQVKNRFKV